MAEHAIRGGDEDQGAKFREVAAKLERGLLTLAFCGHFSAGKSTLVNALCGADLLPSSPIPTSANVVTIADGAPSARMSFRASDGTVVTRKEIPIEELHGFAVDGEGVAAIEVAYPVPLLGGVLAFVDTPGVDSTDAAHRAATESALHLADVVFYVTDYNHVLSDVNFRFLRQLAEWGKPVYVIVNQIDKHRESEVPFESFRDGIRQAMESWKIRPAGLLFLSLRAADHPLSQWEELLRLIENLKPLRAALLRRSAVRSAEHLADRYLDTLRARRRDERERLQEAAGDAEEGAAERLAERRGRLEAELDRVRGAGQARIDAVRAEFDRLLENANLTPAETRDKAAAVLDSVQPGFKVGWFQGAAKTEAERGRRLALLTDDLNRQITANLNGHVRELLRREAREAGWDGEDMETALEAAFAPVAPERLRELVKPGMGASGQAVLNYAADISADVKSRYRKAALGVMERIQALCQPEREREAEKIAEDVEDLKRRENAVAALSELERAENEEKERLLALLPERDAEPGPDLPKPAEAAAQIDGLAGPDDARNQTGEEGEPDDAPPDPLGAAEWPLGAPAEAIAWLERAAGMLRPIPALAKTADALAAKAERFRSSRFTIALFGAFSAGKSSLANALIGQQALPVSPNPTTAAINRIVAPTAEHPPGTAWITMKTEEAMLEDIRHSLRRLGAPKADIERADTPAALLDLAARMNGDDVHPRGKPHLAFLRAASEGWSRYGGLLGTRFLESGDGYRSYAADEQASCFVAEIDLAVDSPFTRGGAVLVDTPGADSINARHTGVAFEYIKNSDAVLFVTYYNHAFTEADRQFLNQLGSVKDVFELDKMFFLINAADLASSEEELAAVREHVAKQLLKHGIRSPRLFAVSSLQGLEAKVSGSVRQWQSSGFAAFEEAFRSFAGSELGSLAAASARKEIERAGRQLEGWLHAASADADARKAEARRWMALSETWRENGRQDAPGAAVQPVLQETAEQLYHLRQRVYYRFGEHFMSAFHPSVLQDDGRDLKKLLAACWEDLKRSVGEDLAQELRSAGLRLEGTLRRSVEQILNSAAAELAAEGFAAEPDVRLSLELPIGDPYRDGPNVETKRLWQAFKSPKHFFENDGKNALREWTAELLFQAADEWLAALRESWSARIAGAYRQTLRGAYEVLAAEMAEFAARLGESMLDPGEAARLQEIRLEWKKMTASIGAADES
jgi:GTPase Era involved in 16S rRNA processing